MFSLDDLLKSDDLLQIRGGSWSIQHTYY